MIRIPSTEYRRTSYIHKKLFFLAAHRPFEGLVTLLALTAKIQGNALLIRP